MGAGGGDATETSPSGSPYRLFATRSTLGPAVGGEGQIAVRVTRLVDVGFSTSFARSSLKTELTSDVEGIPDTEAAESISQVTFQGSVLVNLPSWKLWGGVPFASGGAGYLRHLHEGRTLSEGGAIYHLGGGLTYLLTTGSGLFRSTGLRASARAVIRTDGAAFDDGSHVSPGFGVSFFGRF